MDLATGKTVVEEKHEEKGLGDSISNELENEDHEEVKHRKNTGTEKTQLSHAISSGVCAILVCESTAKGDIPRPVQAAYPVALASRGSTVYPVAFLATGIKLSFLRTRVFLTKCMCVYNALYSTNGRRNYMFMFIP